MSASGAASGIEVSAERIAAHIRALEGVRHPVTAPGALDGAADYIAATLASLGYPVSENRFDDGGRSFRNILATCSGTTHPERRVVVVAHIDKVSDAPGADDNASGVAVLLEMAAALKGLSLEKTVQFAAVNLEENSDDSASGPGTRGSSALARLAREEGWHIEGVVVLESVAYAGDSVLQTTPPGLPLEVPAEGNFIAVIGNEKSRGLVQRFEKAVVSSSSALPFLSLVVPGNGDILPDTRRSDHAPFWDNGFPAVMLTDTTNFRNPHYHRPTDNFDTLNIPFAAEVCRSAATLVIDLAVSAGLPPSAAREEVTGHPSSGQ